MTDETDIFQTRICKLLEIQYPILQAGMGYLTKAELIAAVSNAGGLGVIGAAEFTPEGLRDEIRKIRSLTDKPFGIDVILPAMAPQGGAAVDAWGSKIKGQLQVILDEQVPVFVSGLGNPGPFVEQAHAKGIKVLSVVGNVKNAKRVAAAGVDAVIAQGQDGGGHTGRIGTLSLVPQVVDAVDVPVLAAGGLSDGRGLVAALALGASGVWLGTRFVASLEAAAHVNYKNKIVEAGDEDTVITRAYSGKTMRVIKNKFTEEWSKRESEIKPFPLQREQIGGEEVYFAARAHGNTDLGSMPAGQGSGLIGAIKPAAEIVREIMAEARRVWEVDIRNR
ncbi:MAG: DUF561 domain-containing protein [Chloroflexi bacterium]|nr:DUF561 domain-containing protein [Chloroflexota bacterium]